MYISIWMLIPFLPRFMGFISMRKFGYNYITHIRSMFGGDDVPSTSVLDIVYPHSIFDESFHEISSSDHLELPQPKCINCIFFEPVLTCNGEVNAASSKCIKFSMVDFNKHTNISFWNAESLRSSGALCGPTGNYFQDKNDY